MRGCVVASYCDACGAVFRLALWPDFLNWGSGLVVALALALTHCSCEGRLEGFSTLLELGAVSLRTSEHQSSQYQKGKLLGLL
jgi:hypothetical protein